MHIGNDNVMDRHAHRQIIPTDKFYIFRIHSFLISNCFDN